MRASLVVLLATSVLHAQGTLPPGPPPPEGGETIPVGSEKAQNLADGLGCLMTLSPFSPPIPDPCSCMPPNWQYYSIPVPGAPTSSRGEYDPSTHRVGIGSQLLCTAQGTPGIPDSQSFYENLRKMRLKGTLVHELTHCIQSTWPPDTVPPGSPPGGGSGPGSGGGPCDRLTPGESAELLDGVNPPMTPSDTARGNVYASSHL